MPMDKTQIIRVDADNLDNSHICCAISQTADAKACAQAKKDWMARVFADDYQFHRLNDQGKVFIETIPGENAWCPIAAEEWLFIDCFWVSGKFKGQGIAGRLLEAAVQRAKTEGRAGLCALSADKKRPFLSDPGFYKHKGFVVADTAPPYYQLLALPFAPDAPLPRFLDSVRTPAAPNPGVQVWHSDHCPHAAKFAGLLGAVAQKRGVPFAAVKVTDRQTAQAAPNPFTTWAMFYDGAFVTNEILSEAKFEKFLDEKLNK